MGSFKKDSFILNDSNAQKVFGGQLISQACDKMMTIGMIWVLTVQFSPKWIPWFIGISALPHLLLSTSSGKWIEKKGALRTVIGADAFRGFLFLAAGGAVFYLKTSVDLLLLLFLSIFISNTAGALFNPAILSLPVEMLPPGEKRDKLTALLDSCFSFGNVLGPLSSALVYSALGLEGLLIANGVSYLFSALLASGIKLKTKIGTPLPEPETALAASGEPITENEAVLPVAGKGILSPAPKSTLQILKNEPVISGMLGRFLVINLFLAPIMVFMPWYTKNVYGKGIAGLAALEVFLGVGTLAGTLLLSFFSFSGTAAWKKITLSAVLTGAAYLAFSFTKGLFWGSLFMGILGFFLSFANVMILNFFQSVPEPQDVPGVMAVVNLITVASLPVSMALTGALIEDVPVKSLAVSCSSVVILAAFSLAFSQGFKRADLKRAA
jgi:predicted MFS family arabinose efflux permease